MKNNPLFMGRHHLLQLLIVLILSLSTHALEALPVQQQQVSGTVTDGNGLPLAGVAITVKGTQKGTITDYNGTYSLLVHPSYTLNFSFLGFKSRDVSLDGRSTINVQLEPDITDLGTVEINAGYYTVRNRERTGNIAKLEAKTIEKQPVNNPLSAMQGHLAGVNIVQSTGVPGGGFEIDIRGQNFINGSTEPLYIIDGVPMGGTSMETFWVSSGINSGNVSPLNDISPDDIASIEILKDADATAIYGSRAANGVVLITTKKGKVGRTSFRANISSSLGQVSHFLDLMDTEQYLKVRREGIIADGRGDDLDDPGYDYLWPDLKTWDQNRYTDWQKELIGGTAYRNKAQLSVSGGSEHTQFLVSGSIQKQTTVFPGDSNYKKASLHNTLNHRSEDGRFSLNLSTIYTREHNKLPRTDLTGKAYRLEPNAPEPYDEDGQLNWEDNTWDNPLASLLEDYLAKTNTLMANGSIAYRISPNLEVRTNLGFNTYDLDSYKLLPHDARNPLYGYTAQSYSSITINSSSRKSWIMEPQIHWSKEWKDLEMNVLLGSTFQQQDSEQLIQRGRGFSNNSLLFNLSAANSLNIYGDSDSEYRYSALFGRINLNWKRRYILNLTGRRDGSSRFGPGRQFGNFGAVGMAWLFSEEGFLRDSNVLSFGKLRGSYGTTGSDNIGDYQFLGTYKVTGDDYNGVGTLAPSGIANPQFGWESNKKLEFGLELGFFRDRILLNTSWFRNRSSNQLIGLPLAATTGFSQLTGNFDATVENTGLEIELRSQNIRQEHFQWNTTFNLTVPKNRLAAFPGLESSAFADDYIIGRPLTIVDLYHAQDVDPDTGTYRFEDYNGDGSITSSQDKGYIEDFAPKFYGGLGNTLTYKNLSLDLFFQFKKQRGYNLLRTRSAPGLRGNGATLLLDYWQQPGDNTPIMKATAGLDRSLSSDRGKQRSSSAAVSDASFVRLRNISLTYRLPDGLAQGIDLDIYIQGQNLLTFTPYDGPDPEQTSLLRLPPLRQFTLGIQLGL
ncbi:SusC/RagA family TonB-linked outer membrane protein [Flavisericum labens]|uniref:SusC/RagA family TonB-linked outer membrane protein n=1 Tax=Flavisericum labens TaxID=3377112 RepID=UPI00387AAB1C